MSIKECQVESPPEREFNRVGDFLRLQCKGENLPQISLPVQIVFPKKEMEYSLHVLEVLESSPEKMSLVVTGYKPGEYVFEGVELKSGEIAVPLAKFQIKIESVVKNPQEAQEFSAPPLPLQYPFWFWILLGAIGAAIIASFVLGWIGARRVVRRKQRLAQLKNNLSPILVAAKSLRILRKKVGPEFTKENFINELDSVFRIFLTRQFQIPAEEWSDKKIQNWLQKTLNFKKEQSLRLLRVAQNEVQKSKKSKVDLTPSEREQIVQIFSETMDSLAMAPKEPR